MARPMSGPPFISPTLQPPCPTRPGGLADGAAVMAGRSQGDPASLTHGHPPENGGTLVLVSQDGIQRPPLHFPQGGHLLSFLSCLENGLLPRGQLEPPLWTQQGKVPQGLDGSGWRDV